MNLYDITSDDIDDMSPDELKEFIRLGKIESHAKDKKQHATKILLNCLYGAMGTPYFRFYNIWCAEGITLTGQVCVAESYKVLNDFNQHYLKDDKDRIIGSDTDSAYCDLTDLVTELCGKDFKIEDCLEDIRTLTDKVIAKKLDRKFDNLVTDLNSMPYPIKFKREAISSGLFIAKKRNVMLVYDDEGVEYATPKMKITGLEAITSSTPKYFQSKLKHAYKLCFGDDESKIHKFVDEVKKEVSQMSPDEIAGVITVNGIEKYKVNDREFKPGTTMQARGAIAYNYLIKNSDQYQPIHSGDKVYIIQMKLPNPVNSNVLCYNEHYPSDLIDSKYVDNLFNYNKYFIKPLNRVLEVVNWNHEFKADLSSLFG